MASGLDMWEGNVDTTTLLFSLKVLAILHQVNTIVMEHFKSGPANKQHAYQSINIAGVGSLIGDDIRTIERKSDVSLNACKYIG